VPSAFDTCAGIDPAIQHPRGIANVSAKPQIKVRGRTFRNPPASPCRSNRFLAQILAEDFADMGFRQIGAKFDEFGTL